MFNRSFSALLIAALALPLGSCGSNKKASNPDAIPLGPVTQAFVSSSQTYQIPQPILMALAYKESGLTTQPSRLTYSGELLGPAYGDTIVGLPFQTLGLTAASAGDINTQLSAYGNWVQSQLREQHIQLPATIRKVDDYYDWIWQLARLHHRELMAPKNIQILFAREIMQVLNQGFIWQDATTRERIELPPLNPVLDPRNFSTPIQANLQLDTRTSELFFVDYLQLSYTKDTTRQNRPTKIRVIHCPFSLSSCLGSQTVDDNGKAVSLQAHYVIPPDSSFLTNPVKVLQHKTPVTLTGADGQQELVTDALVIMLVGNSGRYVDGKRLASNPSWYTKEQLKSLGRIVEGVCQLMAADDASVDVQRCRTPGEGLNFSVTATDAAFHYGDIPDFDPSIFWSFIKNPDGLSGSVMIQLPPQQKLFPAGSPIPVSFNFITGTAKLEIQLLQRCPAGKTVWSTLQSHFIRNVATKNIDITLFDQGPNLNGQQFIRALAFDSQGRLMGWSVEDFFLNDFDSEGVPGPSVELCDA